MTAQPRPPGVVVLDMAARVRISSFCSDGGCVGVVLDEAVRVVDTKAADGPELRFTREEWAAFVAGVKNGEFDLS